MVRYWTWLVAWREKHRMKFPEEIPMPILFLTLGLCTVEHVWWGGIVGKNLFPVMDCFNQHGSWNTLPLFGLVMIILACAGCEALLFGFVAIEAQREICRRWKEGQPSKG